MKLLLLLLLPLSLFSQKKETLDNHFKPTQFIPSYVAIKEQKDSLWERSVFYIHVKALVQHGFYLDETCEKPQGTVHKFYPDKKIESIENYKNGVKHGVSVSYREDGRLKDSGNYENGLRTGIHLAWTREGWLIDSMNFDGQGRGSQIKWREDGTLESAGLWELDTVKVGRWKYFHPNGQMLSQIDYQNGKVASMNCFDDKGAPVVYSGDFEKEAYVENKSAYTHKLMWGLRDPIDKLSEKYTKFNSVFPVNIEVTINEDGSLTNLKPLFYLGLGVEDQVAKAVGSTGPWKPATRCGIPYKSKLIQPIVLSVTNK